MVELALKPDPLRPGRYTRVSVEYFVSGTNWRMISRPHTWCPPTDVYETDQSVVVRVEISGMGESEISVTLDDQHLAVRGVRQEKFVRRAFHQMEIQFGEFCTEVDLPCAVNGENVEAEYNDGFLRVVLSKIKPHRIQVKE